MLRFALKNMATRRARMALVLLSIVVSASVGLLAYNVSMQVNEGIVSTAAYFDLIVGPAGSSTQLAMNTMFFVDEPLGTISYEYVEEIERSGLANDVVPIAMGDSFNGARVVGATPALLEGKPLRAGKTFDETFEAVVGSAVAERYGLQTGASIVTSHGLSGTGAAHGATPLTVVGILKKTGTAYDNAVFTSVETVWAVHGHEEAEEETEGEEEHHHHEEGQVCAILVRSKSFSDYYRLSEYYGANAELLCINPATVLRGVLEQVDLSTKIVYLLSGIILAMNILVISVITLLNMVDTKKEVALMRLIGIGMKRIALLYLLENGILGLLATALSFLLAHACLGLLGSFAANMGIVLGVGKVYALEFAILAAVFVINIIPTTVCIFGMARKDGISS